MVHLGHTPASYLSKEYAHCLTTFEDARQQIALTAINIYHAEVSAQFREVKFKVLEHEADAYEAQRANIRKVDGYFQEKRSANLPFSFSHFIARAIDKLYGRGCVDQIQQIIAGPKSYAPGSSAALLDQTQDLNKESSEVISRFLQMSGKGLDNMTKVEREQLAKEVQDVFRAAEGLLSTLAVEPNNVQSIKAKK